MSNSNLFDLHDRVAVVTGASYGLGSYFAEVLAGAGAKVVLSARSLDKLDQVAAKLRSAGAEVVTVSCDVSDPEQVAALAAKAVAAFGQIDIAVNNAGQAGDGGFMPEKLPPSIFDQILRVNLNGVWYCCQEFGARMLARKAGGSIINVASILGMGAMKDGPVAYHASKGALINMTRLLGASWAERNVRVNALAPGFFASEMTSSFFRVPGIQGWTERSAAANRVGRVEELAGPLLFLASHASSFMTGQTLVVDGGFSATIGNAGWPAESYDAFAAGVPQDRGKRIGLAD